jgi:hypothetical protein
MLPQQITNIYTLCFDGNIKYFVLLLEFKRNGLTWIKINFKKLKLFLTVNRNIISSVITTPVYNDTQIIRCFSDRDINLFNYQLDAKFLYSVMYVLH